MRGKEVIQLAQGLNSELEPRSSGSLIQSPFHYHTSKFHISQVSFSYI